MGGDPLSNIASPPRLEERERKNMLKTFKFGVSAVLTYTVEAETEEKARELLVKEGGSTIQRDDIIVDIYDYKTADCYEESIDES